MPTRPKWVERHGVNVLMRGNKALAKCWAGPPVVRDDGLFYAVIYLDGKTYTSIKRFPLAEAKALCEAGVVDWQMINENI